MTEREILLYNSLNHLYLLEQAPKLDILRDLMGMQAQFSRNPQISLRLRANDYSDADWDDGLIKIWSHRGTIHVIPEAELGLHLAMRGYPQPFVEGRWRLSMTEQQLWAEFMENEIQNGNATRDGLKNACILHGMSDELLKRAFHGWGGLIQEMAWRGMLVCDVSTQKRYRKPKNVCFISQEEAQGILLRRYFQVYGPATILDCASFFGLKLTELRPRLEPILAEMHCACIDGTRYYHGKPLEIQGEIPSCVLIPGFDQLILGYRDRSRMLDAAHARRLTNAAGIIFPSLLLRGRIRAAWKIRGERMYVTPFETLLKKDEASIARAVKRQLGIQRIEYL